MRPCSLAWLCVLTITSFGPFANSSYAYLTPGKITGTELALIPVPGDSSVWDLTFETDGDATAGGGVAILDAVSFSLDPFCEETRADGVICLWFDGDEFGVEPFLGNVYLLVAVGELGGLNTGINAPRRLGRVVGANATLGVDGLGYIIGLPEDRTGFPEPVDFYQVPEPSSLALACVGLACAALRRRRMARARS